MAIKALFGLQAALFASNTILNETNPLDITEVVNENTKRNKDYLDNKKEFLETSKNLLEDREAELFLPVNLMIFDKYYKNLSEWTYMDKYTYKEKVLVFNKKEYDHKAFQEEDFYKENWLKGLTHKKDFQYFPSSQDGKYPDKDDSKNINWIDGKSSSLKLSNLLSLNAPLEIKNSFEMHDKIIELDQSFPMSSEINIYSGYWKEGELNQNGNVINDIEFGRLKSNPSKAIEIYHNFSSRVSCSEFSSKEDRFLQNPRKKVKEGFDSKCDRINLLDFWSFFWNNRNKSIFSSGYAGYKIKEIESWNKQYFFYSLGKWSVDKPSKIKVNSEKNKKNLWYVDFDDVFVPEIKLVEESTRAKNQLKLSFYLNYKKIKDIEAFLKIASSLKYKLKFNLNAKNYETDFSLKDVLESKQFPINTDVQVERVSNNTFSNFEVIVYSDNEIIQLNSKNGKEFKFKPNLSIVQTRFHIFRDLAIDQEELKNFYYSEIKRQEKLDKLFYFISRKPEVSEREAEAFSLPKEWISLLKLNIVGSDYSSAATIKFYDFVAGEDRAIEVSNLLTLPKFKEKIYPKKENFSSVESLVSSQHNQKIGDYFWENMELKLEEKDLLSGMEIYSIKQKEGKSKEISWDTYYKEEKVKVRDEISKYLVPNLKVSGIDKLIREEKFSSLFLVNSPNKGNIQLSIEDFSFSKKKETDELVEIEVKYNKEGVLSEGFKIHDKEYKEVKITGKTTFKINKKENSITMEENSTLPFYYINSGRSFTPSGEGSFIGGSAFIPIVVSSAVAGVGASAGVGFLVAKKLRLSM